MHSKPLADIPLILFDLQSKEKVITLGRYPQLQRETSYSNKGLLDTCLLGLYST